MRLVDGAVVQLMDGMTVQLVDGTAVRLMDGMKAGTAPVNPAFSASLYPYIQI